MEAFWSDSQSSTGATGTEGDVSVWRSWSAVCAAGTASCADFALAKGAGSGYSAGSGGQASTCLEQPCCESKATLNATTLEGLQSRSGRSEQCRIQALFSVLLPALGAITSFAKGLFPSCSMPWTEVGCARK